MHPRHRLLVAGNGAGGKDHAVALRERRPRDDRPRRCAKAPRAARPGCRCRAPAPCRAADSRRRRRCGNPGCRRDSRFRARPARCAPWRGRPARPRGRRRRAASATARMRADDARRRWSQRPAPARCDQLGQGLGHVAFGGRAALAHGIGGIADQRETALVAERAELGLVGRRADDRRRVDLPVAGMQDRAERRCG